LLAVYDSYSVSNVVSQTLLLMIVALCGYIADRVRKYLRARSLKELDVSEAMWRDHRIQDILTVLRDRFDAQRVYFSRFHNGDHYVDDSELLKKTRTHESVREGMQYQAEHFRGMLISTIPDEIELAVEDGPSWRLVRELKPGKFKNLCMMGGAHAVARCAVRAQGKVIGFIGVDFDQETKPNDEELKLVCDYAARVAELC
jgi:hypothetical protein